jgi:peptidyl-prolyl cis-trans isomerase B (cyclophilin B)
MMAKRNYKRERERSKALARQQRMIQAARRRRRNQIIAGVTVAALAAGGIVTAVVVSVVNSRNAPVDSPISDLTDGADLTTPDTGETPASEPGPNPRASYTAAPSPVLAEGREWTGQIQTSVGNLEITLDGVAAPQATANFVVLAHDGYFDATSCHRVTLGETGILQCGSVTGDGTDNPGYQFGPLENTPEGDVYPVGTIAMARTQAGEDTMGSQFFIVYQESVFPGGYTIFGHVTSGIDIIEEVAKQGTTNSTMDGPPNTTVTIDRIELQ